MKNVIMLEQKQKEVLSEYMPNDATIKKLADFFTMFSDSTRVKIITALCLGKMCVNDLSVTLNINQTTVSHQLKFLKTFGAVSSERDGKLIYYSIKNDTINDVMLNGVNYLLQA
ncbi:MAG: helix-turn-helix transcriptional regulator [Clostridia bacterium]|nr:helix-turn-helix transcriptional regulator [Clostridia bacterium]